LRTPEKAGISRQRKVQVNPAETTRNVRGSVDPNVSYRVQTPDFGMWIERK